MLKVGFESSLQAVPRNDVVLIDNPTKKPR